MWELHSTLYLALIIFIGCSYGSDTETIKAIQIVETKTLENGTKVIRTIDQSTSNGPSLQNILTGEHVKDMPVLVYSISGKTRGGKSFLLNLMYKYLQANGDPGWTTGTVPRVFPWVDGIDSCTRGLWISPTIFRRKNSKGQEVGILLMDNQGLFDGEVTSGESVAMSGVSTIISFLQMFNMKEKISTNDMEQIMLNLVPDKPKQREQTTNGSSLLFVVRDFVGGRKYGYGLENGRKYIESEQQRGTDEYKSMWQTHRSAFDKIDCVLLPHPGIIVTEEDFTTSGDLSLLETKFISTVDLFFQELFSPTALIPRNGGLTGQMIYNTLKKVNGLAADEKLSYYNMFLEKNNDDLWQKLEATFEQRLNLISDLRTSGSLVEELLLQAHFKGASAEEYTLKLRKRFEDIANDRAERYIVDQYKGALKDGQCKSRHNNVWPSVTSRFNTYLLGEEQKKSMIKREIIKEAASTYYKTLRTEQEKYFKQFCENAQSQQFYNKMATLKTPADLSKYAENEIEQCTDFERAGGNPTELNELMSAERQIFKVNVGKTLLRSMYKVKEYLVNDYSNRLGRSYIEQHNAEVWPDLKVKIYSLQFETDSERNQIVNSIVRDIAGIYYSRLSNEVFAEYESLWGSYGNQQFLNTYNNYNSQYQIQQLASWIFPEFSDFRSFSYKWAEEKSELAKYLELAVYKEYHRRGYRFHSDGSSYSSSYQIVIFLFSLMYLFR